MAGANEMSYLIIQANAALVKALQGGRHATTVNLLRFLGRPESPGEPTRWLSDFDVFVRQCGVPGGASGGVG